MEPTCEITYYSNGNVATKAWRIGNKLHRKGAPAFIAYRYDGSLEMKVWYINDQEYCEDGGASEICYFANGSVSYEEWYDGERQHRVDGPACIRYHENGAVKAMMWYVDDELHCTSGPAYRMYHADGSLKLEEWYWHGNEMTKDQWERSMLVGESK